MQNYIKNSFGLNELKELKKQQLEYQKKVDNIISKLYCKEDVVTYLIISRMNIRKLQINNLEVPIKNLYKSMKNELEFSINHYKKIYDKLENNSNKCNSLIKINNELIKNFY